MRDLSDVTPSLADPYGAEPTPLAQAAEHMLLARQGALTRQPLARPEATRVIVVANQKGGVGKTTSTVNVAAALAQFGQRVLVVDLDPQGNASTALAVDHRRGTPSTYDLLVEGRPLAEVITTCPDVENLFVVPATIDLAGAEIELVSVVAREQRLHKVLHADSRISTEPVETAGEDRFDFVFIDCPPSLGLLTINALVAGQEMLIPIQAEYYALEGLGQLLSTVDMVRAHLNPELAISAILVTMYDARTRLAAGVAEEVRDHFGDQVHQDLHPALGARLGGAVVQPDRDDLRSRLAGRDELSRRRAGARGEGPTAPGRPGVVNAPRTQRRGLGRGLGSLIPTSAPAGRGAHRQRPSPAAAERGPELAPVEGASFAELPIDAIRPNAAQPRQVFDEEAMAELVHSIREVGLLQPVVVRRTGADSYELVMGERRLRASQQAGLSTIPAIIRDTDDTAMLRDALLENLHRAQLNPLEEASAYQQLLEDFGCTHEELASRIGRSRPQISNTIRLLKLGPAVQRKVAAGVLSAGHARSLLAVEDLDLQDRLATRVIAEGISVRGLEEIVAVGDTGSPEVRRVPRAKPTAPGLAELAERLSDRLETRVKVDLGRTKGRITVEFASLDDLRRIVDVMDPRNREDRPI